jgi:hypothetical protein
MRRQHCLAFDRDARSAATRRLRRCGGGHRDDGARARRQVSMTDGPYAETKEQLAAST